ncbi:hypothetical protein HBB16_02470 [Pseudonocardia sp. MCCB 268]|nr:hypothetical protein [Pseudonocardia cytotoxica]
MDATVRPCWPRSYRRGAARAARTHRRDPCGDRTGRTSPSTAINSMASVVRRRGRPRRPVAAETLGADGHAAHFVAEAAKARRRSAAPAPGRSCGPGRGRAAWSRLAATRSARRRRSRVRPGSRRETVPDESTPSRGARRHWFPGAADRERGRKRSRVPRNALRLDRRPGPGGVIGTTGRPAGPGRPGCRSR